MLGSKARTSPNRRSNFGNASRICELLRFAGILGAGIGCLAMNPLPLPIAIRQRTTRRKGKGCVSLQPPNSTANADGHNRSARLRKIKRDAPPFVSVPRAYQRGARWVDPHPVAEVTFTTWTAENLLRHPSFEGLREDKPAGEVKFERSSHKRS